MHLFEKQKLHILLYIKLLLFKKVNKTLLKSPFLTLKKPKHFLMYSSLPGFCAFSLDEDKERCQL